MSVKPVYASATIALCLASLLGNGCNQPRLPPEAAQNDGGLADGGLGDAGTDAGPGGGAPDATSPFLKSLSISPAQVTLLPGVSTSLVATGVTSAGSTVDLTTSVTWTSSADQTASVSTGGVVQAVAAGTATVTATIDDLSATASVTVSAATVTSLVIDPSTALLPVSGTVQLDATALLSDGTTVDVSSGATWSSSSATATVSTAGLVTAASAGTATITASFGGQTATVTLTVTASTLTAIDLTPPSPTFVVGEQQAMTATGQFADGSTSNLTASVTWTLTPLNVATVDASGMVSATGVGSAQLTAAFNGVSGTTTLTVVAAAIQSLSISPSIATLSPGATQQFTATGTYSDGMTVDLTSSVLWTVGSSTVAAVSDATGTAGLVTALAVGTTQLTATFDGQTATAPLTVTSAPLVSLLISPSSGVIAVGQTTSFTASATDSSGATHDVTQTAVWSVLAPTLADVSNSSGTAGQVTGVTVGTGTVQASISGLSATASLTVTAAALVSIAVTPATATLSAGNTQAYVATGTYSDGTTRVLTSLVTWSVATTTVARISTAGLLTAVHEGSTSVTATYLGVTGTATVTVTAPTLVQIVVTPITATLMVGDTQAYTATAVFSDGTTQNVTTTATWTSSDSTVATLTVNTGGGMGPGGPGGPGNGPPGVRATGVAAGTDTITATYMGETATATLTVTAATLVSISIDPVLATIAVGETENFQVVGVYSDGSTETLTNQATWTSSDATVAAVSNATMGMGGFPGGGGGGAAQVLAEAAGTTTITASYMGFTATATVTVTAPVPTSIQITPVEASIAVGETQAFEAIALYSDNTTQNVTGDAGWTSSTTTVAEVTSAARGGGPGGGGPGGGGGGTATALAAGTTTITATWNGLSATATLTVTSAVLTSITVSPANASLAAGLTQNYTATGIYSDGTSRNLTNVATWVSSNTAIASISNAGGGGGPGGAGGVRGQATALEAGQVTITASDSGLSATATLTVTSATLTQIQVTPAVATMPLDTNQSFVATAVYSDFSTVNVTNEATWTSSSDTVLQVSNGMMSAGQATALKQGTATITATWNSVSGTAAVTVSAATISQIQVTPALPSIPIGLTVTFTATAVYTDNTTVDVTRSATWTSATTAVATVAGGAATAVAAGTTEITAAYSGVTGTTTLKVGSQTLRSIAVTPTAGTVAVDGTLQLTATGTWSDGSTLDVTQNVTWISSSSTAATISNAAGSRGLATGLSAGSATINAYFQGVDGSGTLTVIQ
jgi:uncharacterized protein YjdB